MRKMIFSVIIVVGVVAVALVGCKTSRSGYESAPYQVVRTDGKFELRDYPALTVVQTPMARGGDGGDGSFMRLFRFISGSNEAKQKIAMTTPVFMSAGESNVTMAFVLPTRMKAGDAPKPTDASVNVSEMPAGRFAVLRFKGGRNARSEKESLAKLQEWLAKEKLQSKSAPIYGYFDPPWTPGFWRRNEVMLMVEK
ncbi:MAG: hypothetical protein RLY20_147 [Verrucomicrobiota bacterium]